MMMRGDKNMSNKKREFIVDELLFEFYGDDVPTYVKNASKNFIEMLVSDFMGTELLRITIKDVVKYYYEEARNIVSGCRFLAGHGGDWYELKIRINQSSLLPNFGAELSTREH